MNACNVLDKSINIEPTNNNMSLYDTLNEDLKTATRNKKQDTVLAIRQIKSEFWRITEPITLSTGEVTNRPKTLSDITDSDILKIIAKLIKSNDVMKSHGKYCKDSVVYMYYYNKFKPKGVDRETILAWVKENVDYTKLKNEKQAFGIIKKQFPDADIKLIIEVSNYERELYSI